LEMLKNKDWGKIINLSSINGTKFFSPDEIDYDISKAWIIALTKNFAKAFAPKILVNAIAPWNINTESTKENSLDSYDEDIENIYLKRFWKTEEIVKTILFLASDEASYINWTCIYIDWWFSC
jgi:NAD(P)-dependent dehydrogenase (short-subunit alcohol dehydrogenase family)